MKKYDFSRMLRYYRKANHLSVAEVAKLISENVKNVTEKSIYSWENGTTKPPADTFMYLCELYRIDDVLEAFGFLDDFPEHNIKETLTKDEIDLIIAYRQYPEFKHAVRKIYGLD